MVFCNPSTSIHLHQLPAFRQLLRGVVGEGQPFAEVSYKRHTHQVLRWPCHSFPFELGSGKLEIQVFLAEDDLGDLGDLGDMGDLGDLGMVLGWW